jgi:ribosomal protein L39E
MFILYSYKCLIFNEIHFLAKLKKNNVKVFVYMYTHCFSLLFIISKVPQILNRHFTRKQILITKKLKQNTTHTQYIYIKTKKIFN